MLVAVTDQDGFAQISFRMPNIPSSNRTWAGISVVDIAGETVWDTINFRVYLSLSVSISPLSASILVGQSVTFTSTVSGGHPPYNYQWYLDGNPVSGATSNTWTFTPTAGGIYYVHLKVTDDEGNTAQSDTARITVATVPVGGYSIPIQVTTKAEPIIPYIAFIAALTAILTKLRPKTKRKH
jgi:PKD repeat protein